MYSTKHCIKAYEESENKFKIKKITKWKKCFSAMDYNVSENCQNANYMRLAEQLCPHTCATCCKTRKFNCRNVAQCENFSQEMCRMPSLTKIALELCPHTCGLCDLPGAGGECPDSIDGCESLRGFCQYDSIRNMCQRTCFSRACLQNLTGMRTQCRRTCGYCIP
ncbi:unnamed protein product [Dracunculus medinensis]|uniref:ShKT domain-containing protein n=1 Tax=Dracunculus medinensis TaxID=318479 RepID=A0A0N4US19_DRAME|nr:unnamed protein product [Dracunculus medinensis]